MQILTPPGIRDLRKYRRENLAGDVIAGVLVAALAIPQALGYSVVAGVPVQVGLYTLPPALLAYALFGSSRVLFVGPVSTISVLSGSLVRQLSGGDAAKAVELTASITLVAGVVLLAAGLMRLGWVANFLSEPIVTGFVTGLVILIIVGEVPGLLGLDPPQGALITRLMKIAAEIGQAHVLTALIGLAALVVIFGGSALAPRVPWSLVALVLGVVGSHVWHLGERGVRVVGSIPSGLPVPSIPIPDPSLWSDLLTGGIAVAGVGIAEGLAAARTFSSSSKRVEDNTELVGNGIADLASSLFGGIAVAGSLSKTAANSRAGAKTQLSGVVSALMVVSVLVFATGLLTALPKVILSAIVVHAVWGLLRPALFKRYAFVRRDDLVAAVVAVVAVLVLGPLYGLLAAIAQSLLGLIFRTMQVDIDEMGRVRGEKAAWGAIANDPQRKVVRGVCVLRPDGPLFWANAGSVVGRIEAYVEAREDTAVLVLDLEATNQMDTTSANQLDKLIIDLRERGITVMLVRVFTSVREILERAGVMEQLAEDQVWHSISAAVKAAKPMVGDWLELDEELSDDSSEVVESHPSD